MITLHQHHLGQFTKDRRGFYEQYVLKLPQQNPDYFRIGRAVDVAVKNFHLFGEPLYDFSELNEKTSELVFVMTEGYCKKYKFTHFKNYYVPLYEIYLDMVFTNYNDQLKNDTFNVIPKQEKFKLLCSPDLVADDHEGNPWIIELKTGAIGGARDFQTITYCWAYWKINKKPPTGIIKRTIKKPVIKQTKKETPEQFSKRLILDYEERPDNYYKIEAVEVTLHDILEHERYIMEILGSIYRAINNGRYGFY